MKANLRKRQYEYAMRIIRAILTRLGTLEARGQVHEPAD
jgi:hypothetical protein